MSGNIAHFVKCVYCNQSFDRDKHEFVAVSSRRYAHKDCYEREQQKIELENKDKNELENYISEHICQEGYVTAKVRKQIKLYMEQYDYTYSGMLKALIYFYEIKGNSFDKANGGIGIIPYIYEQAYQYYFAIWLANQSNDGLDIKNYEVKTSKVTIQSPKRKIKKKKLFSFLDEEELNGE